MKNLSILIGNFKLNTNPHTKFESNIRMCMSNVISSCSLNPMKLVFSTHSLIIQSGKTFNQSKFVLIKIRALINFCGIFGFKTITALRNLSIRIICSKFYLPSCFAQGAIAKP